MTAVATMPSVRGRLTAHAPLAPLVWFKSGGKADWLFEPADDMEVVEDANWVTSRQPSDLPAFNRAMLRLFAPYTAEEMPLVRALRGETVRGGGWAIADFARA